jgi:4-aminobutyrate aminotransferase-like enzyme
VNSGSEANDLALRLARAHSGAREILVLEGAYHGNLSSLIEISSYKYAGPGGSGPGAGVHALPSPDDYRGPYRRGEPQLGPRYAQFARERLAEIAARGARPAAFIAESLPGCAGQIELPEGYLAQVYGAVRAAGGVCIADEVQVGFGRLGSHFWGFQSQGVVPDIVTLGKPIGNGHPLGAVITSAQIAASFDNGMEYFNTFGGNPVSCAAGLAVLEVLQREQLQAHAARVGAELRARLCALAERHPLLGDVRGRGLFLGVELVLDRDSREPAPAQAAHLVERMRERGVLLSADGPLHNVIKLKPPLVFSQTDAELLLGALTDTLAEDAFRS